MVIPSYNHADYLKECVDSVLMQTPAPLQVIVVDDGSSDGSVALLQSYGNRITLLQQRRRRQACARNAGLAVAQGELVAFLDSDDRYRSGRLAAAVAAFQADAEATLVWSDFCTINAEGQPVGGYRWQAQAGADFRRTLIAGNPICNATVTVKRDALLAIGGFDERIPRACDGAAWFQLAARGHRFVHLPHGLVDYRLHGGNDSRAFAAMARDRDVALQSAAASYLENGVLSTPADLTWLRGVLVRQFSFQAAAWVQRQQVPGRHVQPLAWALEALGSDTGLRGFAFLKFLKTVKERL